MPKKKRIRERVLLIAATVVAGLALALTYMARTQSFDEMERGLANGSLINLSTLKSPDPLNDKIYVLPTRPENQFVAAKIYAAIAGPDASLQPKSVSDLLRIKVRAADLRKIRGLDGFKQRLEGKESIGLLTPQQLAQLRPLFVVRTPSEFRSAAMLNIALVLFGFYACHLLWSLRRFQGDELFLPIVWLLSSLGMALMISLADPLRDAPRFVGFAQGVLIGCAAMYAATHIDYRRVRLRAYGFFFLLALAGLSGLLIVFGSGPGQSDAKVNLWGVQPIEIIKLLLVLYLASYFTRRWELLREMKSQRILGFPVPRRSEALPVVAALALVLVFLFLQKDLGPALLFYLLFLVIYAVARNSAVEAVAGLALLFLSFLAIYKLPVSGHLVGVSRRVAMWISPWDNAVSGGIQLAHSFWALATGGLSGVGLGLGDANLIPAGHTDLILSVLAEQAGFIGLASALVLYYLLFLRGLRVVVGAKSPYPFFLSLGLTCLLALQVLIIAGGVFALMPLTGVTSPFLSYGKSSLITSFFLVGLLLMISAVDREREDGPAEERLRPSLRPVLLLISVCFIAVLVKVGYVQVLHSDEYLIAGILGPDADRVRRFHYNPRIERIAVNLPRGSIYDRNGVPIASSDWNEIQRFRETYAELGFPPEQYCSPRDARHYPLNFAFVHIIGNVKAHWNPPLAIESEYDGPLKGYDDRAQIVTAKDLDGQPQATIRRDYRELVPLLRHRYDPEYPAVKAFQERDRNLHLSVDARLQVAALRILKRGIEQAGRERGALVLLAADTGEALALVSYPTFDPRSLQTLLEERKSAGEDDPPELLDRARRGVYPPGSTFKVVTAAAALRKDPSLRNKVFLCERLDDGRVGTKLPRYGVIRDDRADHQPHGQVAMANGLIHSCNAYFAQLGVTVGESALHDTAAGLFQIYHMPDARVLKQELAQASFGQGSVLVTPFDMARIAATFANEGRMPYGRWVTDKVDHRGVSFTDVLPKEHAQTIAQMMRGVIQRGTGHTAFAGFSYPVAGKTGTAEISDKPAHSWFIGFAPWSANDRSETARPTIAFSVLIENGGYGGRAAAPVARSLVEAWLNLQNSH
jgi:cell division protein FtsI/penicillin-binding protein 2/cell division protein FtsW (lipid II flippase)